MRSRPSSRCCSLVCCALLLSFPAVAGAAIEEPEDADPVAADEEGGPEPEDAPAADPGPGKDPGAGTEVDGGKGQGKGQGKGAGKVQEKGAGVAQEKGAGKAQGPRGARAAEPPLPPPPGNDPGLAQPPPVPPSGTLEERVRGLVQAIREDRPELADPLFFPREPFRRVKAIKDPDRYHATLLKLFRQDVRDLRRELIDPAGAELVSFQLSRTRRWIPAGKEANALPYWAAYKSALVVRDGDRTRKLFLRVAITWDGEWYVTHLTRMK